MSNASENHRLIVPSPALQNPIERNTTPEEAMQDDLFPELPPSGGYENIVTAMDVFFRSLISYPTSFEVSKTIIRVLINIMTMHTFLQTRLNSEKCTGSLFDVINEVAGVLGLTLKHATTKHAQTVGLLERCHASIKQTFKIEASEWRSLWHKYISIAVLDYDTSYLASIGCELSRVFSWTHSL